MPVVTAFIEEEVLDPFWFFDIIMDGVFFTDVIINLLSAYVYEEILVTNHWVYIYFLLNYFYHHLYIILLLSYYKKKNREFLRAT